MAVNLSVRNLYDRGLLVESASCCPTSRPPRPPLTLEITESEVMEDPVLAMDVLGRLRALGVRTSDRRLRHRLLVALVPQHLPIDEIKIDQSFVGGMAREPATP